MKCYLHIGTEKTATTTIQSFLDLNRKKLYQQKFVYTKSAGKSNNRALAVTAYSVDRRDDFTRAKGIDCVEKLESFKRKIKIRLRRELRRRVKSEGYTVIFSSEHLQSRLKDVVEVQNLKNVLKELGFNDIYIVVYLRRPAEIVNSLYSTSIKAGNTGIKPPPANENRWNQICDHKKTLEKFSDVFGSECVIPRIFDPNEFVNKSVIEDFLSVIGVNLDKSFTVPEKQNESLSQLGVEILRRVNHIVQKWTRYGLPNPARDVLVRDFECYFQGDKYVMPADLYRQYDDKFSESNEWVRKNYFKEKERLFSNIIPERYELKIREEEMDRVAALIASHYASRLNVVKAFVYRIRKYFIR